MIEPIDQAMLGTNRCGICGGRGHNARTCDRQRDEATLLRLAELREAGDAIAADIVAHENVRALVEERLAEAYERRAQIEVEIRRLRNGEP